ncbi:senescence-associated carboxylesterase 101 isoform X1 [Raphanus sativus]|uniref:Senescence-associated carboxylesterase 101 isoform X1 n=1 Tax=Raphanus sativus TaxID=3726 RepID=A0A6J0MP50_RAPSA|nr:senescence-associated carboxylesterase 101 isoform X1 [Raphanus sativus]
MKTFIFNIVCLLSIISSHIFVTFFSTALPQAMDSFSLKYLEPGKLMLNSGLLQKSWRRISEAYESTNRNQAPGLVFKTYQEARYTIVVFVAQPIHTNYPLDSVLTPLSGTPDQNPFHFLCLEKIPLENIPSFSLHTPAYQLFDSAKNDLIHLKSELLKSEKHVIITGAVLGGSVASLFTLWLLETIDPKLRRPLCITFGSPLIGDAKLQQILENSLRNSCFLHVADAAQPLITQGFKPFGTFLICLGSQYICIDDPETVTELLSGVNNGDVLLGWRDYGQVLGRLAQPSAVDPRLMIDDGVINRMAERAEKKKLRYDPLTKLNHMKIEMMYLEWYKKKSEMGYYDRFKTMMKSPNSTVDMVFQRRKKELNEYWRSLVAEVEKMPQSEKSLLKTRSLFAGNNYRRIVEPLDIAEYYLSGKREYRTTGRSRHYEMLEKWFEAEKIKQKIKPVRWEGRDLSDLLMFDSCFWAEVEEAILLNNDLSTQLVGREVLFEKLMRFEEYVWKMIEKREVSPEIFLEESSFMKWWREYKEIKGLHAPPTYFTEFMNSRRYQSYGKAC